jgi:hypothetical protein
MITKSVKTEVFHYTHVGSSFGVCDMGTQLGYINICLILQINF